MTEERKIRAALKVDASHIRLPDDLLERIDRQVVGSLRSLKPLVATPTGACAGSGRCCSQRRPVHRPGCQVCSRLADQLTRCGVAVRQVKRPCMHPFFRKRQTLKPDRPLFFATKGNIWVVSESEALVAAIRRM